MILTVGRSPRLALHLRPLEAVGREIVAFPNVPPLTVKAAGQVSAESVLASFCKRIVNFCKGIVSFFTNLLTSQPPSTARTPRSPSSTPSATSHRPGVIVPLYTNPTDPEWSTLLKVKEEYPEVPILAVVNPDNGVGAAQDPTYQAGIDKLEAAGISVVGYVATGWAHRALGNTEQEIRNWKAWYPEINGIFFDEMSNRPGHESYYSQASTYARSLGLGFTVGNPGMSTIPGYEGTVDAMLIYEGAGLPTIGGFASWYRSHDRSHFGLAAYGVSNLDPAWLQNATTLGGWIYVTNAKLPDPYQTLPPYFSQLVGALAKLP